ncbi:MAG TPA: patatin-like phospholipase family protein [Solirubrobacteraceae bacterium]|nr:patatin-like phospholipase family protein [Solirubrobacteraceae bacterium]
MRVLAIDGGGIRGLIAARVLAEIERRCGRPAGELFDLVAGTSTGAIIACALTRPEPLAAEQIATIYVEEGPRIFDRTLLKRITSVGGYLDERYDSDGLVESLRRHLGTARLADARPDLLLTAYDLERRRALLLRRDDDLSMVDAAHASSAAPSYFEPVRVGDSALVDGGVFAANPAMCAYAMAGEPVELLVSLGTGEHTRRLPYDEVKGWGQLEWARPIIDVVFDGGADAVDLQLSALIGDAYVRLQTPLHDASDDLDDASPENIAALEREADRLIAAHEEELDRIC